MKNLLAAAVILSLTVSSCTKSESLEGTQVENQSRAHKGGGSGGGSTSVAQVTGLSATVQGSTTVSLTWNSVPYATSYWIYRNDVVIAIIQSTSYTDSYANAGTSYTYAVAAVVNSVLGTKSTSVTVSTP